MKIRKIPITQINPAPYNPRVDLAPSDPEYRRLEKSMTTFGYVEPLVWNERDKTLISGHQRLKILIAQGKKEVEVSVVDLPLKKEKALNIALNKITGRWDEEKLSDLLSELSQIPDFDMDLTGFEALEISELFDSYGDGEEEDDFDFDACVESIKKPITKPGDLIELGPHRVLCGDSSNPEHIKLLLGNSKVSLVHIDPPYNVDYYGGNRPRTKAKAKKSCQWERIRSDNMDQADYEKWLRTIFTNILPYLAKGAPFYCWNGFRQFGYMNDMLSELKFHVAAVITWAKPNFSISYADYNQQTEFCLYGWRKDNGAHIWHGPTNETTLWEVKRDPVKDYIHPTQKPVALGRRAMRNSSQRGDLVLDMFLGSGSTLIAAESLERRCFGLEIDPRYCDAIVRRYIAYIGQDKVSRELSRKYLKEVHHEK